MREAGAGEQPPPPPAEGGGGGWGATPRAAREGLAGVAAGGAAVLTGYPFDTVRGHPARPRGRRRTKGNLGATDASFPPPSLLLR